MLFDMTGSDGALTRRPPEDITLVPGTSLRLNCTSSLSPPVLWKFASGSGGTVDITSLGVLTSQFTPYFSIDQASLYDLVALMSNADQFYCGTYTCAGNNGAPGGESSSATVASKYKRLNVQCESKYFILLGFS